MAKKERRITDGKSKPDAEQEQKPMQPEPMQPEIVLKENTHGTLKNGQMWVEILTGKEKGLVFKTSTGSAEKIYGNTEKYRITKKK